MSEGQSNAWTYPLVRLWWEARIARERIAERLALQTSLQHAMMTAISESVFAKKGAARPANKQFQKLLKGLTDGEEAG